MYANRLGMSLGRGAVALRMVDTRNLSRAPLCQFHPRWPSTPTGHFRLLHSTAPLGALDPATRDRIGGYVRSAPVVVFMKGTQQEPLCGFSRNVKLVLDLHRISFKDYNVLEDEQLRQGVKEFSEWPTIPQLYVNGKFVGGCDIVVQMHKDGEMAKFFDEEGIPSRFSEKFPQPNEAAEQK